MRRTRDTWIPAILLALLSMSSAPACSKSSDSSDVESRKLGGEGGGENASLDNPYRRCVRTGMENSIREVRAKGGTPDHRKIEGLAVFSCQITMKCSSERECNVKARAGVVEDREALQKWE